jgi:hypothetical protein
MLMNRAAIAVFSIALTIIGCHRRPAPQPAAAVVIPAPPPRLPLPRVEPGPEPLPRIEPPPAPVPPLATADDAFISGDYDQALTEYQAYLEKYPAGDERDRAMFHAGLIQMLRPAAADRQRGAASLKELLKEFPNSSFGAAAKQLLSVYDQMVDAVADARVKDQKLKQLTSELDRLKKIDADRRRRR